jgi:HSP20 family protein
MTNVMSATCAPSRTETTTYRPAIDIVETEKEYRLRVDLPGVAKSDVDLDVKDGVLTIRGKVPARHPENVKVHVREYGIGDFERTIRLGDRIEIDGIQAEHRQGLLTIHLPKVSAAQPRKIELS